MPAPVDRHPTDRSVGPHNSMHATPFSFVGGSAGGFHACNYSRAITFIEQSGRFRISHLRSDSQTHDGAQLRREPRSVLHKIGLVNPDTADLNSQSQQLIARFWRPNRVSAFFGSLAHR